MLAERHEQAFFYSRTPMLALDVAGVVIDLNATCRELFGVDIAGCQGRHYRDLLDRLGPRIEGQILPAGGYVRKHLGTPAADANLQLGIPLGTADLRLSVSECEYVSERFGRVQLRVSEVPQVRSADGQGTGAFLSFAINEAGSVLEEALNDRLRHELMWEVYAASYDAVLPELPFYQEVVNRHVQALESDPVRHVLDLGAGTGVSTVRLLDLGKTLTAVDNNRAMLRRLRSKLDETRARRLTIIEDTAESLPYASSEAFDAVSVLLAFFDMHDPWAALREAERVLKPGGTLIVTEPRSCFDVRALMTAAEHSLAERNLLNRLAADWARIQSVAPHISRRIQRIHKPDKPTANRGEWHAEAIAGILRTDGFQVTAFRESHHGNCATIMAVKLCRCPAITR